jgi:hypothetical protein
MFCIRIVTCMGCVIITRGVDWMIWFDTFYTPLRTTRCYKATTNLHISQFTAAMSSVYYSLHCPFPGNGFYTWTITVSINFTLQISRYYSTNKVLSSRAEFQLHWTALTNSDASVPQLNSSAGVSKLNWFKQSHSQGYVTTDYQAASLSWNKAPIWCLRSDLYYSLTIAGLLIWGALSDGRTGLLFARVTAVR